MNKKKKARLFQVIAAKTKCKQKRIKVNDRKTKGKSKRDVVVSKKSATVMIERTKINFNTQKQPKRRLNK